jgi:hypothetical protein
MSTREPTGLQKSARKSASPERGKGRPFVGGAADPRAGRGPRKGTPGAGRPPNTFRDFVQSVREGESFRKAVEAAARDPESRAFGHVLRLVSSYDPDGPDKRVPVGDVQERLRAQIAVIQRELAPEQARTLIAALDAVWR